MEQYKCWEVDVKVLENFSSKAHIINFIECFLHQIGVKEHYTEDELKAIQFLRMLFYNPLIKDKMHVFPIYLTLYNVSLNSYNMINCFFVIVNLFIFLNTICNLL